jgi:hypothetical protein
MALASIWRILSRLKQIADVGPMFGLKKQRIFSMKDRPL